MSRLKLSQELERKSALAQAVALSPCTAYPSPSHIAALLKKNGVTISRQAVRNYYREAEIEIDAATGLWIKKGNQHGR